MSDNKEPTNTDKFVFGNEMKETNSDSSSNFFGIIEAAKKENNEKSDSVIDRDSFFKAVVSTFKDAFPVATDIWKNLGTASVEEVFIKAESLPFTVRVVELSQKFSVFIRGGNTDKTVENAPLEFYFYDPAKSLDYVASIRRVGDVIVYENDGSLEEQFIKSFIYRVVLKHETTVHRLINGRPNPPADFKEQSK